MLAATAVAEGGMLEPLPCPCDPFAYQMVLVCMDCAPQGDRKASSHSHSVHIGRDLGGLGSPVDTLGLLGEPSQDPPEFVSPAGSQIVDRQQHL